jgi:hypothetical protein
LLRQRACDQESDDTDSGVDQAIETEAAIQDHRLNVNDKKVISVATSKEQHDLRTK